LNYKEVDDPSIVVAFELLDKEDTYILAWTTTPWTLPSNLALMVGPDLEYVLVKDQKGKKYILAAARLEQYIEGGEVLDRFKGDTLLGSRYKPLFPFFERQENAFRVIGEETVAVDEGTGIVHTAPAFGEVDFFACKKENIELGAPLCGDVCKRCRQRDHPRFKKARSLFLSGDHPT
jgi:isoleucyl-tRNA synthetase